MILSFLLPKYKNLLSSKNALFLRSDQLPLKESKIKKIMKNYFLTLQILLIEIFLTFFASITLTYTSMAISIGPWITPTIILISNFLLFKLQLIKNQDEANKTNFLTLIQIIPSQAAIISVAIGFTLPTLYYLEPKAYAYAISHPSFFYLILTGLTFLAASWGVLVGKKITNQFTQDQNLKFPLPDLFFNTIADHKAYGSFFVIGNLISFFAMAAQRIILFISSSGLVTFFSPGMVAIGFMIGGSVLLPFAFGQILKIIVFPNLTYFFKNAVSSSTIIFGTFSSYMFCEMFFELFCQAKKFFLNSKKSSFSAVFYENFKQIQNIELSKNKHFLIFLSIIFAISLYFKLPKMVIVFNLFFSYFLIKEICYFAATTGTAPFGRFTTQAMIASIFLFRPNNLELVGLCLFVAIACAAAVNFMLSYKLGILTKTDAKKIVTKNYLGAFFASLVVGACFVVFLSNLEVGSPLLFAQRGLSRAMLVKSLYFDWQFMLFGAILFSIFKIFKISGTLALSAIIMPNGLFLSMFAGSMLQRFLTLNKTSLDFAFAGVFAGESIFVLIQLALFLILRI